MSQLLNFRSLKIQKSHKKEYNERNLLKAKERTIIIYQKDWTILIHRQITLIQHLRMIH